LVETSFLPEQKTCCP